MAMSPADEIRATMDVLRRDGWQQNGFGPDGGPHCFLGARAAALGIDYLDTLYTSDEESPARRAIFSAIHDLFPDRLGRFADIIAFNDHKDTTWSDVVLVAKFAANELEMEG